MKTVIEQIGDTLRRTPGVPDVQIGENQLLVTVNLGGNRKQTVRLEYLPSKFGKYAVLRFQSRVCVPNNAQQIRKALELNASNEFWGLALDTSVEPPVIDVLHSMIAQGSEINAILAALTQVASRADELEEAASGGDHF
jgi:hypothetical protein